MNKRMSLLVVSIILCMCLVGCGKEKVTLGEYEELSYSLETTNVTEEDIDEEMESLQQSYAASDKIVDRVVAAGDTVNISYSGKVDNVEYAAATNLDYNLEVGSHSFPAVFEDSVLGHSINDEYDVSIDYDKDYATVEYRNKKIQYTIKINYIVGEEKVPDITDAFIDKITESAYKTVKDYREYVRGYLDIYYKNENLNRAYKELLTQAMDNSKFKGLKKSKLNKLEDEVDSTYKSYAKEYEVEFKEFISKYLEMTEKEYAKERAIQANESYKVELMIDAIIKDANIKIKAEDREKYLEEVKVNYGYGDVVDIEKEIKDNELEDKVTYAIKKIAVAEFIMSKGIKADSVGDGSTVTEEEKESIAVTAEPIIATEDGGDAADVQNTDIPSATLVPDEQ